MKSKQVTYAPFTPRINDPVTQYQPAVATDEVARAKFLSDIRVRVATLWTDQSHSEIWTKRDLLGLLRLRKWERLRIGHRVMSCSLRTSTGGGGAI